MAVEEIPEIEDLYLKFLRAFYDQRNLDRARVIGVELQAALDQSPAVQASIRGDEIRSLLAELDGNLSEAIHCRESEIRKILELHSQTVNTASWDYVFRQYDYADVSDRLELLANLHANNGDLQRAIETLLESKQYCQAHKIPFDGEDMLKDFIRTSSDEG